jgi:hypothetical protein
MKTSYLLQGVNLLSSIIMLVLILAYFDPGRYLQWVLFTTISGGLIQLEGSMNVMMTRFISRAPALGGPAAIPPAAATAKRVYHRFALLGGLAMLAGGGAYLAVVNDGRFSPGWAFEWLIFCAAFIAYYFFGHYACLLIALERARRYASIALFSRIINVAASVGLVLAGFGMFGMVAGVALAFGVGGIALRKAGRDALAKLQLEPPADPDLPKPIFATSTIFIHAGFVLGSYFLYRVALLLAAASSADTAFQASFGLALQIFALIMMIALVPLNMRVAPLVAAVASGNRSLISREAATLGLYVNLVFLAAVASFVVLAGVIDQVLPSRGASLPPRIVLTELSLAFLVEINILVFVNVLLAAQKFRFVFNYYLSAAIGIGLGIVAWRLGLAFHHALVLVPASVQAVVALPAIIRHVRQETGMLFGDYARDFRLHLLLVLRHPIKVGLAFR